MKLYICIDETRAAYGYDPQTMPPDSKQPVILQCRVCQKRYEIAIASLKTAAGRCMQCRVGASRRAKKPNGWQKKPAGARKYEKTDARRCWRCGKHLDFGDTWYCGKHQAARDRAFRLRRQWVTG